MPVLPKKPSERVAYLKNRANEVWPPVATQIGLVAGDVTALATKVTAADEALAAASLARETAQSLTKAAKDAVYAMTVDAAELIKKIKVKAGEAGDGVYTLANIPAPATPAPVGPPGVPEALKVALLPNGTLDLAWKCKNPIGCHSVIYQVYRKVESTGEYSYLGGTGAKKFTDATLPAGVPAVTYQIQGTRTTSVGVASTFVVQFGVGGAVPTVASVPTALKGVPAKIAA